MALLDIVQTGDPILRERARDVDPADVRSGKYEKLVADMIETMRKAPGVGLAAPQIGVGLRIIVVEDDEGRMSKVSEAERTERRRAPFPLLVVHNPTLELHDRSFVSTSDDRDVFFEGCLSVDGFAALVPRARSVRVRGLDAVGEPLDFEVSGWAARIFQHEVDHVDGKLYLDRMLTRSFGTSELVAKRYAGLSIAEVRALLDT